MRLETGRPAQLCIVVLGVGVKHMSIDSLRGK